MSERLASDRTLAVALAVVMVLSVVGGTVTFSTEPASAATQQTASRFEVVDVGTDPETGDLAVKIRATSDKQVRNFNFEYNDTSTKTTPGTTDLSTSDIHTAVYDDGTAFTPGDPVSKDSGNNGEVIFYFDSGSTDYDFVSNAFRVNVTAYDGTYATADTGNRSMLTANHYRIDAVDHTGSPLGAAPMLLYDANTNESHGFSFIQSGSKTFHCRGVDDGGTCTNPDTGTASNLVAHNPDITMQNDVVPAPLSVEAFSLAESNATGKVTPSAGSTTITADTPRAPVFPTWTSLLSGNDDPNVENFTVYDENGNVVVRKTGMQYPEGPPALLAPNERYTFSLENGSSFGVENRTLAAPTKGPMGAQFRMESGPVDTSTVAGQVVDENGNPVSDAVVVAQPERSSGSRMDVYNSTTTDGNGLFAMTLPATSQFSDELSIRVVGTDTSGGTPVYYPTTDANGGQGYVVQSDKTVLPPIELRKGGRVAVDITSPTPSLSVPGVFTSLSQTSTAYPQLTRTANSQAFTELAFGNQKPSSASVALLSPATGSETDVTYNVWGLKSIPANNLCVGNVEVTQGADTTASCSLETGGKINLNVEQYDSVVQKQSAEPQTVDTGFFFRNELVVRNATTGNVTTFLGPDGLQQIFLGSSGNGATIPVPAGDYELELRPVADVARVTTVNDTAKVTVSAGSTTDVTLDRGRAFEIRPVFSRMDRSLDRGGDNTIAVQVLDPLTGQSLDDSNVSATVGLRYGNGTTAVEPVELTYNSTDGSFDTETFTPTDYGIDAGTYEIAVTASNQSGTRTYNSTIETPIQVTDFQTYVDLDSQSVAPGGSVRGLLKAYKDGTGVDAPANNVTIEIYDRNRKLVSSTTPDSGISSGEGTFVLSMPDSAGEYLIVTRITSNAGDQSVARRAVRVSAVDLSVETDRRTYAPDDPVRVTVEATNANDGSAISDATVALRINGQEKPITTDSNGRASTTLKPGEFADNKTWSRGYPITAVFAQETDSGVVRKTVRTGFGVRLFDVRSRPTSRTFGPAESAKIDVRVSTSKTISSVAVTELDGEAVTFDGSDVTKVASGLYRVDLGQQPAGRHVATATVTTASGDEETATTGFAVKSYDVAASLNKRTFDSGETVEVTVGVRKTDGTAVSSKSVTAILNETGPTRQVDSATTTTDADGTASFSLSPSSGGGHYVKITVGNQERYLGLLVNDVSVRLEDGSGNEVNGYDVDAGTTETIHVNATKSDDTAVADGSNVTAGVVAFGERTKLGNATTSGGTASVQFTVPDDIPAREYPLGVFVTTPNGQGFVTGTLNVSGANAKQIEASTNGTDFTPGDTVELSATVTTGDGSPVANEDVDFTLRTEGAPDRTVKTVTTNADGVATYDYDTTGDSSGAYALRASLNETASIKAYSGYRLRSLDVDIEAADGPYNPGDSVSLTVYANDSATGNPVTATGGSIRLSLPGSNAEKSLSLSGQSPYDMSITVPSAGDVTGTRSVSVTIDKDAATDSDSTLVDVESASASANLSIPRPVTAGQSTTVTVNGTVDETAVLTAYSPAADSVAFNDSVTVSSSSDTTKSMTINSSGTHLVKLSVPGVGTVRKVLDVEPAGSDPSVWTGTGVDANATTFASDEDIFIKTDRADATATVVGENETFTVMLDSTKDGTHYGTLNQSLSDGYYLVRLDDDDATNLDSTVVEVSD